MAGGEGMPAGTRVRTCRNAFAFALRRHSRIPLAGSRTRRRTDASVSYWIASLLFAFQQLLLDPASLHPISSPIQPSAHSSGSEASA
jgi:hypothetical protein